MDFNDVIDVPIPMASKKLPRTVSRMKFLASSVASLVTLAHPVTSLTAQLAARLAQLTLLLAAASAAQLAALALSQFTLLLSALFAALLATKLAVLFSFVKSWAHRFTNSIAAIALSLSEKA